ncbi:hypothetical protein [Paenarthrobacter sp. NPDC091669]|uniref:hypothetical protein n=1 Tax=Paenarthrobacter sp. NPDC091669 TaxID=3364384 RepID=UPI0038021875
MELQPTPTQAMALLTSGLLDVSEFPDIAAQWLADGMDSANLRMLAGADNEDPNDIRDLWTATLKDLEIQAIPLENRWPLIWTYELATWKAGSEPGGKSSETPFNTFEQSTMPTETPRKRMPYGSFGTSSPATTSLQGPKLKSGRT